MLKNLQNSDKNNIVQLTKKNNIFCFVKFKKRLGI